MHPDLPLFYTFNFYVFGIVAVIAALLFVTRKSPVAAAMWLVTTMFSLAALFVMLDAQFVWANLKGREMEVAFIVRVGSADEAAVGLLRLNMSAGDCRARRVHGTAARRPLVLRRAPSPRRPR